MQNTRIRDPEKMRAYRAAWRAKNKGYRSKTEAEAKEKRLALASPEELALAKTQNVARAKAWAEANPQKAKARSAEWHKKNRAEQNARRKAYYAANKVAHFATGRAWVAKNRDRVRATSAARYQATKDRAKEYQRSRLPVINARAKERRASDPTYALVCRLRVRLRKALFAQGAVRTMNSAALVGCSPSDFRDHIAAQFLSGMSWDNRSEWDLDHIIPCASFDLRIPEQQSACFHFTNIQPLWRSDNRRKGARVVEEARPPV